MGVQMIRSFPWIDYICSGESDHSFPELLKRIAATQPLLEKLGPSFDYYESPANDRTR